MISVCVHWWPGGSPAFRSCVFGYVRIEVAVVQEGHTLGKKRQTKKQTKNTQTSKKHTNKQRLSPLSASSSSLPYPVGAAPVVCTDSLGYFSTEMCCNALPDTFLALASVLVIPLAKHRYTPVHLCS